MLLAIAVSRTVPYRQNIRMGFERYLLQLYTISLGEILDAMRYAMCYAKS